MDKSFVSINKYFDDYIKRAKKNGGKTVGFAFIRSSDKIFTYNTLIASSLEDTPKYLEKLIKSLLYMVGCNRVITDCEYCAKTLEKIFAPDGIRAFDYSFFTRAFKGSLTFEHSKILPEYVWATEAVGGKEKGKRIGFDAGGSDIKICAVQDGKAIYSEEILWLPKLNANPDYHYGYIKDAIYKAYNKLGGAESLGVSTAGVVADNEVRIASLFIKVPENVFEEKVKDIYKNIADELKLPLKVANDGDVAAYKGAIELNTDCLMGIAMGTSEAVGYVDDKRRINGWLNELAFVPIDLSLKGILDEWSGDTGCGAKYLSQDAVIRIAVEKGIIIDNNLTLAEKLKIVQEQANNGNDIALGVFDTIGYYLGEAIAFYARFYKIKTIMLLGRVTSNIGGERVLAMANKTLANLKLNINIVIPDESTRRLGQAYAAALL